jgi:hypothetical protein
MHQKKWFIVLGVLLGLSLLGNLLLAYSILKNADTANDAANTTDTEENVSSADNKVGSVNATMSEKDAEEKGDENLSESTALGIQFSYPEGWYWYTLDGNTKILISNKANAQDINLGNRPDDYQAVVFGLDQTNSFADSMNQKTMTDTLETSDGAKVSLYEYYSEGGGRTMTAIWKSVNGKAYYGTTATPNSQENIQAEITALKEVISTIRHN